MSVTTMLMLMQHFTTLTAPSVSANLSVKWYKFQIPPYVCIHCTKYMDVIEHHNNVYVISSNRDNQPTGIFKFAHSTSIQGILALLDLYRPSVVPTAESYASDSDWEFRNAIFLLMRQTSTLPYSAVLMGQYQEMAPSMISKY